MKHMRTMFCGLTAALLAANLGCNSSDATNTEKPADVGVSVITPRPLERSTTQPARIEAFEETPLYAKIAGYVDKVHKDIGDRVKKGDTLITLWVPEMNDELERLKAQVELAEAEQKQAAETIKMAKAATKTAESRISTAKAGKTRADGLYQRWKAELKRLSELAKSGSIEGKLVDETRQQYSAALASKEEAAAKIEAAMAARAESKALEEKAQADKKVADARLKVAQRKRERMTTLLDYREIKAPYDGIVVRRYVDTRHFVQPGDSGQSKPLLVVAHVDTVRVFVDVPEVQARFIC